MFQNAYKELSNYRNLQESSNGVHEEQLKEKDVDVKNKVCNEIECLKNEISVLRSENAKYANLSMKIEKYSRIKKCLAKEALLSAKVTDLEKEISSFKEANNKLSEDLHKKDIEMKELNDAYSLHKKKNILIKDENKKLSKSLEQCLEKNQKQNYAITSLKESECVASDIINVLSKNVKATSVEINNLKSENISLKDNFEQLNKMCNELSTKMEAKEKEIEILLLKNYELKGEICKFEDKNREFFNDIFEKDKKIEKLLCENKIQEEKINAVVINLRKEMNRLSLKLKLSETRIRELGNLNNDNVKLRDEISELQYKIRSMLGISDDKNIKIQELVSENRMLKDQMLSYVKDIEHLTRCLSQEKYKLHEYEEESFKLKEKITLLEENTNKISKLLDGRNAHILDLTNSNLILKDEINSLKNFNEKKTSEMMIQIKELCSENSSLKEDICKLTSIHKETVAELHKMITIQEDVNDDVAHKERIEVLPPFEKLKCSNFSLPGVRSTEINVEREHLFYPTSTSTPNEQLKDQTKPISNNLGMKKEENKSLNCLRRKVLQKKGIISRMKKCISKSQTKIEMCK